jgi:hypothetical protein
MKERDTLQEVYRVAEGLSRTLVNRWDLYSKQMKDGRYICVHNNLTIDHVVRHLQGKITLGTYLLDKENNARFAVLDADDDESFDRVKDIAKEIPSYLETSRRGGHLWMFFEEHISGKSARKFGLAVLNEFDLEVEVFPKQGESKGPGSLIRLPFGIHRKSGKRYGFIKPNGSRLGTWREQFQMLMSPQTIPGELMDGFGGKQKPENNMIFSDRLERIRSIPVMEFIGRYIELKETNSGAVGLCPFHEDAHPSFGINKIGNYWHCFAGCGGGSVIDFWMKMRNCDFKTAINELEEMI